MRSSLSCVVVAGFLLSQVPTAVAEDTTKSDSIYRYQDLKVAIRSWHPEDPVRTHKSHSSGSCSHGGSVGLGVGGKHGFSVETSCASGRDRIIATIELTPSRGNKTVKPRQAKIDLSDMRTHIEKVSTGKDGRVYFLVIRPEIIEGKLATKFTIEKLAPYDWAFMSSPVVLNDEVYIGQVGMSGGSLAGIDIAGVANYEFSLLPLRGADPIGVLQDGRLTITTDETEIAISGVRNGASREKLDGPFKVWVREVKGSHSLDEIQNMVRQQLSALEKKKADGDASITDAVIARVKRFIDTGRPLLLGSHARDVREDELDKDAE